MDFESFVTGNGGLCPLPDIADQVVKIAGFEQIDRTRTLKMFQIDVARRALPIGQVGDIGPIAQDIPLLLCHKPDR